ncbi:hypothetical protein NBRC116588_11940 [Pyruvatibacter sp. HU-CL02332]
MLRFTYLMAGHGASGCQWNTKPCCFIPVLAGPRCLELWPRIETAPYPIAASEAIQAHATPIR